jgi:hypothetical protein
MTDGNAIGPHSYRQLGPCRSGHADHQLAGYGKKGQQMSDAVPDGAHG